MDPLSVTAGVVGILDTVSKLSSAISRFKQDYKLADEDLNIARSHALLLKEEIGGLESRRSSCNYYSSLPPRKSAKGHNLDPDGTASPTGSSHLSMDESSFARAMSTARDLLSDIEASFPLRSEPHTWRSKVRWAMKDKQVLSQLKERLQSAESTLQGIVAMEQLRVSRLIYSILLQQQHTMDMIERGEIMVKQNIINMAVLNNHLSPQHPTPTIIQAQLSETSNPPTTTQRQSNPWVISKRTKKTLPRIVARSDRWGFSAQLITLPRRGGNDDGGTSYRAAVHISLFGKMYSVRLQISSCPRSPFGFSFDRMLHVCNIISTESDMAVACRSGDFNRARKLLTSGEARGSDITESGWPVLDYAIESGSARLVRLLLDHGAEPDMAYGEYNMTALQSSFLRGRLDIARLLLTLGADIDHVDSDGYSVLSYLWVVDGRLSKSAEFMRLCLANGFSEVNASDSRGWIAFHRAAAIGTGEDIEAFLRLGASLDQRAEWYGWTPLFFAASFDNVETFQTIVEHSSPDVYDSLDGDGWNLLHCCTYFGAPRVMRLVLQSGVDVNQKTLPAPLPEDPELSYRELTASDIALYMGPNGYQMFMDALVETGRDADIDLKGRDIFWDAADSTAQGDDDYTLLHEEDGSNSDSGGMPETTKTPNNFPIYGAEDVEDKWSLLHWASYNGSPKVKRLLLLKGLEDPEHLDAVMLEDNPTLLPTSPFEGR